MSDHWTGHQSSGLIRSSGCITLLLCVVACLFCIVSPALAQDSLFDRTDSQKEIEIGRAVARAVEHQYPLSHDRAMQERVERVGQALVSCLHPRVYPFSFKVLASQQINAFCLPGGFVYVYEGLLTRLVNDDELAFVLGHEITHGARRHSMRQMEKMQKTAAIAVLADAAIGASVFSSLVANYLSLKYSRDNETEADAGGVQLMWESGFDLHGCVQAMQMLKDLDNGHSPPEYLSDHPLPEARLKRIQAQAEEQQAKPRPSITLPPAAPDAGDMRRIVGTLPAGAIATNRWYPLAAGATWTYALAGSSVPAYTVRVAGAITTDSGRVYRVETSVDRAAPIASQVLTTQAGVFRRNRIQVQDSPWSQEYVTDLKPDAPAVVDGVTFTLQSPEPVTTPCGSFTSVLKIRKQSAGKTYDLWFAESVGLIKRTCLETNVTEILLRYSGL
jgi:Zn-dependent protease with chaperone function